MSVIGAAGDQGWKCDGCGKVAEPKRVKGWWHVLRDFGWTREYRGVWKHFCPACSVQFRENEKKHLDKL